MITFLVLIILPTLIILTRLENRRSRKKVSVDGFKVINGHVVRRENSKIAIFWLRPWIRSDHLATAESKTVTAIRQTS